MADPSVSTGGDDKIVDEATTVTMIKAFDTCQTECDQIQKLVTSAHEGLMARWGGTAARSYDSSMAQWKDGFDRVRAALNSLDESMVTFSKLTDTTEDDNIVQGSGWAKNIPV